jgi:MYXO-CTERM domain-containing protein
MWRESGPWVPVVVMCVALGGCRRTVVWDQVGSGDSFQDAAVAFLLLGLNEADPELMAHPHVAGGSLRINAAPARGSGSRDWSATTLAPEIAEVVAVTPGKPGVTLDLQFHQAGTTDLFVFDSDGEVLAAQPIRVREPADLALMAWEDLTTRSSQPLAQPIHVVGGSAPNLAVSWRDAVGTPLLGGELVTVDDAAAPASVSVDAWFSGEADIIEIVAGPGAAPGRFDLGVASPTASFDLGIEVRARSEADRLEVAHQADAPQPGSDSEAEGPVTGHTAVRVFAGDDRLVGAPVVWDWEGADDPMPEGTVLAWSTDGGGPTAVTACFEALCEAFEVEGVPTAVLNPQAPTGCGCGSTGGSHGAAAVGLALLIARRRRRAAR